ncbi:MAG: SMP-30/gluconolactonase/LRE family protein [Pseudomonadota bacterium]
MSIRLALGAAVVGAAAYLAFWPIDLDPQVWAPTPDPGLDAAPFADAGRLTGAALIEAGGDGPEDFTLGPDGALYTGLEGGAIMRFAPGSETPELYADTDGRPLGLEFGPDGVLYVADAYRGLLAVDQSGAVTLLSDQAAGVPIVFADDLAVIGRKVVFSDASTKFGAKASGALAASLLEIVEQGRTGRMLEYDIDTGETTVLTEGLSFPNGVTESVGGGAVIIAETGLYRLLRIALDGPKRGAPEVLVEGLPGFPDNVERGPDGLYWVGLTSPRSPIADQLAAYPKIRKALFRLPSALRPGPTRHGVVIAVDDSGAVRESLQDPTGAVAMTSGALRTKDALYIAMLTGPHFARLKMAP